MFLLNILPFKSGELSYVYLLKKQGISLSRSASSLYVIRFSELLGICIILVFSLFFVEFESKLISKYLTYLFLSITTLILIFLVIIFNSSYQKISDAVIHFLLPGKVAKKVAGFFRDFFHSIKKIGVRTFIVSVFISICASVAKIFISYLFFINLVEKSNFFLIVFGICFVRIFSSLPINLPGNIGTFEGFVTIIFTSLNFAVDLVVNFGIIVHIFTLIYGFSFMAIFYFYSKLSKKNLHVVKQGMKI
jgi:uncharacterized membrane protein YbhN (UPF0104 family)